MANQELKNNTWGKKFDACIVCGVALSGRQKRYCSTHCFKIKRTKRLHEINARFRERLKQKVFDIIGRKCVRCGISDVRVLQIDHVNGGGTQDYKTFGRHKILKRILETNGIDFQILCANCNWIKRYENAEKMRGENNGT